MGRPRGFRGVIGQRRALAAPRSSCREPGRPRGSQRMCPRPPSQKQIFFRFLRTGLGTELVARAAAAAGRSVFPRVAGDLVHGLEKEGRPKPSHSAPGAPTRWRESARRTPTPARQARLLIPPRDALTGTDCAGDPAPPAAGEGRLERNSLPSAKPSLGAACVRGPHAHSHTHTQHPLPAQHACNG